MTDFRGLLKIRVTLLFNAGEGDRVDGGDGVVESSEVVESPGLDSSPSLAAWKLRQGLFGVGSDPWRRLTVNLGTSLLLSRVPSQSSLRVAW